MLLKPAVSNVELLNLHRLGRVGSNVVLLNLHDDGGLRPGRLELKRRKGMEQQQCTTAHRLRLA